MTTTKPSGPDGSALRVGVLGLGEAGSIFAAGLAAAAAGEVRGFDPADVPAPAGVSVTGTPGKAGTGAGVVIARTHAAHAREAADSGVAHKAPSPYDAD